MAFMFDGLSYNDGAVVRSYEGGAKYRPRLIIKYNNNGKGPTLSSVFYCGYSTLAAKDSDDGSENTSGTVEISSSRMYLGGRSSTKVNAVRFSKVEIPAQAEVLDAYIEFFARSNSSSAKIKIQSEIGNPSTYVVRSRNITSRAYSQNVIDWTTTAWVTKDYPRYRTPSLKNIVEENRLRGWQSGQAMAFKFEGQSMNGGADAYTVNGSNIFRPRLVIVYLLSGRGPVIGPGGIQPTGDIIVETVDIDDLEDAETESKGNKDAEAINDVLDSKNDFKIYPNPTTSILNLDFETGNDASVTAYIYSMNGRLMITKKIDNERFIDVSSLPSGIYLIKVIDKNNSKNNKSSKFIKQ